MRETAPTNRKGSETVEDSTEDEEESTGEKDEEEPKMYIFNLNFTGDEEEKGAGDAPG